MPMKPQELNLLVRLEQIVSNLISEGYRLTGKLGGVRALKHPNGNRMTLIAHDGQIAYIKNGRFIKCDDVAAAHSGAAQSSATSDT